MSEIKNRLRKIFEAPVSIMGGESFAFDVRDIQDAIAEIERLEADRDNWAESSQANRSALTKALKQAQDFRAQVAGMEAVLRDIASFSSRIFSDPHRPLAAVHEKAMNALSTTPPAETDEARDERRAKVINQAIIAASLADYDYGSTAVARAIAESDREVKVPPR